MTKRSNREISDHDKKSQHAERKAKHYRYVFTLETVKVACELNSLEEDSSLSARIQDWCVDFMQESKSEPLWKRGKLEIDIDCPQGHLVDVFGKLKHEVESLLQSLHSDNKAVKREYPMEPHPDEQIRIHTNVEWEEPRNVASATILWQSTEANSEGWGQQRLNVSDVHGSPLMPPPSSELVVDADFTNPQDVLVLFGKLKDQIRQLKGPIRVGFIENVLPHIGGKDYGSLDKNKSVTNALRDLLYELELRVQCAKAGCQKPSIVVCKGVARVENGIFQCQHRENGKLVLHSSSRTFPVLIPTLPPNDLRKK